MINGEASFCELMSIQEIEGVLLLQVRHFNQGFYQLGNSKNESENFVLFRIDKNHIFFDGLTFKKVSEDELHIHVLPSYF